MGHRKFTAEFKRDAVELVVSSGRSVYDVARELGLNMQTLRNWVNRYRHQIATGGPEPAVPAGRSVADKDAEIAALRAKVAELQEEKEILRKAAVYFAKEMDQ